MSTGQILGGGGGAIIGAILAAPTGGLSIGAGALLGGQLGLVAGGLLDPPKGPTIQGPRLNDLSVQTSTYGQFIPRTYGTIGLSGNVFWLENNKLKEVTKKKKSGGKGGGATSTQKTFTYFATFAVGLCDGPIAGVRRIWIGPDLIYDAGSDDLETIISSNSAASRFSIYLGTDTQQPDPRIQAEMGVANCPAFRGLAYIVLKDLALEKYGNSVAGAQVRVEVVNLSTQSTSLAKITSVTYDAPHGNVAFSPKPYFISNELVCFYAPQWSNDYPAESSFLKYEIGPTFSAGPKVISVSGGTGVPPSGDSDDKNEAWKSRSVVFLSGGSFSGPDGYIQRRGKTYAGITLSPRRLFSGQDGFLPSSLNINTDADCFAIKDNIIYAISATGITVYNISLSVQSVHLIALPALSFPLARAEFVDGALMIYSGTNKIYKVSSDFTSFELYATLPAHAAGTYFTVSVSLSDMMFVVASSVSSSKKIKVEWFSLFKLSQQAVPLSSIVATEAARSSLIKPADIDTTGLTDAITGFKVAATGSIRNSIEPLRGAWPFDVVQSGYQIKATSRGSASVATIPVGELAIDTQLTESREMDSQLPQNVTVKYLDKDRDYDVNEQRAQRDNTEAVNSLNIDLPVVLSAAQAAQVADKLIRIYALEKSDFSFTLPAPYRYLEPGDVITIATDDASFVLRLVSVNHTADGRLECAGRPSSASTYVSIVPGAAGQGGSVTIPLAGATAGTLIDCPVIDEGLQDAPGFAAAFNGYSSGWPGGILYRTADEGQTWTDLQAIPGQATAGTATGVLSVSQGNLVQAGGTLTVSLISGTLESVTQAQMFNGANIAAYGVNGRWEIIRFQNAALVSTGVYTLETFWRGDRGTEWATGLHVAGDQFILMTDPDLAFVGMPVDSIGSPRDYRSVTSGADIDSATSATFTYTGVNLETYSGVHPVGTRASNDLTIAWKRRTRVGGAWRDNVDASLGESVQAYEVDIMQGAVVKRTLAASTPSVLYTSAQQIADFGSNQASVLVRIYQMSSVVGRGYPLETTL
jgi:hypothetical protein